jgi:hypothetical protein
MAKLKYRCINYGECEKADAREKIELVAGEEAICPECSRSLQLDATAKARSGIPKPILLGIVAVILIGAVVAGIIYFWPAPANESVSVESALKEVWPWLK